MIVEPVAGNMNMVVPTQAFHDTLRDECTKHGAVLIFDEVMTGFRVGLKSAQAHFGITPDLTTFGKIIGAGLPVGAFGGKREIMEHIAPLGGVYQAGTLSGNPLAMRAGIAMFDLLTKDGFYDDIAKKVVYLTDNLEKLAKDAGIGFKITRLGGMFGMYFTENDLPKNFDDVTQCDDKKFATFFMVCLSVVCTLHRLRFEVGFMSSEHSQEDLDFTLKMAKEVFEQMAKN